MKKYRIPSDLEIIKTIVNEYYTIFINYDEAKKTRATKIYVPIDIEKLSNKLKMDSELLFSRLYYYLDSKHRYDQNDGSKVYLFTLKVGNDNKCINYPYLTSIYAGMIDEHKKFVIGIKVAISSLLISIISIVISLFI